eukprot:6186612-Pleurochrysis_carterae.AAC.1
MTSTVIGSDLNISIVHKQNVNNLTIYVARNGLPSNDDVLEFVIGQPVVPIVRAVIGGPSIVYKIDTFLSPERSSPTNHSPGSAANPRGSSRWDDSLCRMCRVCRVFR